MIRSKLPHVGTTIFTVMTNRARELNAINLAQGFPDYDAPAKLKDLVAYHVAAGHNQYAPMIGVPQLREQIALKLGASYGRLLDSESEITITLGATEGIFSAIMALVHPGDEVILFDPSYDSYAPAVLLAGGRPIHVPLHPPRFQIDWDRVRQSLSAAHTPGHSQHAAESERDRCECFRSRRARGPAATDVRDGARRRGLRAHDLRRRAACEHRRSS